MADEKLSTKDILAAIRAQKAGGAPAGPASQPAPEATTPAPEAQETPPVAPPTAPVPASSAPKGPAAKPGSTKDILAAIRAQGAKEPEGAPPAGAPVPAAEVTPPAPGTPAPAKPASTKDILAAARAQAGGAAKPAGAAPASGAPKSTADIMASIRGKTAAGAAAPAAKPAAAAGAAPAVAKPEGMSVQQMVKAVREGQKPAAEAAAVPAAKPAKVAPPMPQRPAAPAGKKQEAPSPGRRAALLALLLSPFAVAWIAFAGAMGVFGAGLMRFMFPNVLVEPPTRFKVGPLSDYPLNTVSTKWTAQYGVWVVHTDQYDGRNLLYALISVCTHLGCTPSWLEGEQKFKCPCHGSGFYITGINFEGPAPRPLERAGIGLSPDSLVEIDKSVKFQEEMGQWQDATSYLETI